MRESFSSTFASSLKSFRDILRNPTALNSEEISFQLSKTLQSIHLHQTSISPSSSTVSREDIKAIRKYIPSIQTILLNDIIPTYYDTLSPKDQVTLKTFFVPPKTNDSIFIRRQVALSSYTTLPAFLNTPKPGQPSLVKPSRKYLIGIIEDLVNTYSIDDLYYAVYLQDVSGKGKGRQDDSTKIIQWEEAIKSSVGIPAKVGNAVGRWKVEGGSSMDLEIPKIMESRLFFDRYIIKLESLMYELAQDPAAVDYTPIRMIFEKLCSIGLLTPTPSAGDTKTPSLFLPLLPPLLNHLHHPSSSPLQPYPSDYLPSIFLSLPSSSLASFVDSLLSHLTLHLIDPASPLEPDHPDKRIKRSIEVLTQIIGLPKPHQEAWNAVIRSVLGGKGALKLNDQRAQARNRLIVGWIAKGGENAIKSFIEVVIEAWTDRKYVKYTLYAQQFNLTHIFLLSLALLPQLSSWLVALSHRSKTIMAFQAYLSHPDPSIRRLGMVVAEILSELTIPESNVENPQFGMDEEIEDLRKGLEEVDTNGNGKTYQKKPSGGMKRLKFSGIWDGNGEGREECRWLRRVIGIRDNDAFIEDHEPDEEWLLGWNNQGVPEVSIPAPILPSASIVSRGRSAIPKPPKNPSTFKTKTKPKIVMLDPDQLDDPMEGYESSSPTSSRSPSPTPSYLEEVHKDPSLAIDATQKKKVARPVYIPQLVALLKERDKPESIEMGLKWGESLIRAKREFGLELAENAVAVALMALGLNDPFELEGFNEKRQGIMTALVACSPKEVAPFLCEQYFNTQYSLQQKSVILTALAMGARELAGLSVPAPTTKKIDFPSKTLPPSLHKKYLTIADIPPSRREAIEDGYSGQLEETIDGVRNLLLSKGARKGDEVPEIARERGLKVKSNNKTLIAEVNSLKASQMVSSQAQQQAMKPVVAYKDISAEYFIMPLINRFWQYYRDSSIRESRAISTGNKNKYKGSGTGMIMSPMGLEKFLITLSVLLHASRHSPVFLSILAPEASELALTIGSRFLGSSGVTKSLIYSVDDTDLSNGGGDSLVIGSTLELLLVVLDTSVELDKGRSLSLDKPGLVLSIGEFATEIFQNETEGKRDTISGQGGLGAGKEGRIKANAAAVVLKVGEIGENFGGLGMRF